MYTSRRRKEVPGEEIAKGVREFGRYIAANKPFTPDHGSRYRSGETISTAFVESTVNQVVSKRFAKKGADALHGTWRTRAFSDEVSDAEQRTALDILPLVSPKEASCVAPGSLCSALNQRISSTLPGRALMTSGSKKYIAMAASKQLIIR